MPDRMPNVYEELRRLTQRHPDWIERLPPMKKRLVQGALENLTIPEIALKNYQVKENVMKMLADITADWIRLDDEASRRHFYELPTLPQLEESHA